MTFQLIVKSYDDETYRHVIATRKTEKELERVDNGVNINLNHEEYYTVIEEIK